MSIVARFEEAFSARANWQPHRRESFKGDDDVESWSAAGDRFFDTVCCKLSWGQGLVVGADHGGLGESRSYRP
jgi:hypothetical protein